MFLFISFVCLIGVTLAQSDVVDEIGEIAMRECKKVLKEKNVVADTVWHFSKTLCSDMQDATETYFSETIISTSQGMRKSVSDADKYYEDEKIQEKLKSGMKAIALELLELKTKDEQMIRGEVARQFEDRFFRWLLTGKENYVRSEKKPKKNDGPVKIVVGKTFKKLVQKSKQDVFVEFYAPWCGHCQALEPKWDQLGELFKNKPITIAKFNADANDPPAEIQVGGYPTLMYFKAGEKEPIQFEDEREIYDMLKFIDANRSDKKFDFPPIPEPPKDNVIVLDDDNFDDVVKENPLILVKFYAPWCGHCKSMAPAYKAAADELLESGIAVAKLDATKHTKKAEKFNVEGFPTLFYFVNGKKHTYSGGREQSDIVEFMLEKAKEHGIVAGDSDEETASAPDSAPANEKEEL